MQNKIGKQYLRFRKYTILYIPIYHIVFKVFKYKLLYSHCTFEFTAW